MDEYINSFPKEVRERLQTLRQTIKAVADSAKTTEVINALQVESRSLVDEMVAKALTAGGAKSSDPADHGWMYQSGFQDPDGHLWEVFYADPKGPSQS